MLVETKITGTRDHQWIRKCWSKTSAIERRTAPANRTDHLIGSNNWQSGTTTYWSRPKKNTIISIDFCLASPCLGIMLIRLFILQNKILIARNNLANKYPHLIECPSVDYLKQMNSSDIHNQLFSISIIFRFRLTTEDKRFEIN